MQEEMNFHNFLPCSASNLEEWQVTGGLHTIWSCSSAQMCWSHISHAGANPMLPGRKWQASVAQINDQRFLSYLKFKIMSRVGDITIRRDFDWIHCTHTLNSWLVASWQRIYNSLTVTTAHIKSSTELVAISSQSSSTAVSRDSLNYSFSQLNPESGLNSHSAGPNRNHNFLTILSLLLIYFFHGNIFSKSLRSNEHLPWSSYSGFQASCHNKLKEI
jgi:hypothetical protein